MDRLASAFAGQGGPRFEPFRAARGGSLAGEFEVRAADGRVRRMQRVELPLPAPLARAFAHRAPLENAAVNLGSHALTFWAPTELIELQVGYRWHGFNGRRMREWDERYVVFAEDGGDPVAMRLDEPDGPVWIAPRGEGRYLFREAAPCLAAFYGAVALWLELREPARLAEALKARHGAGAEDLWLWRELVSRVDARR